MLAENTQAQIPTEIEDLTPEWLTAELQERYPGAAVTSMHLGTIIHGTATKVRLLLTYNDEGHRYRLPPTMWFKGGLEPHSLTADMLKVCASEAAFFRAMSHTLGARVPAAFAARIDLKTNFSFVLLEDLLAKNASFGHASRPIAPSEAAAYLSQLAAIHARYWKSPQIGEFPWLTGGGSLLQSCDIMMSQATWDRAMTLPRGKFVTGPLRDFSLMRHRVLNIMESDSERPVCFVHGDAHIGNTYATPDHEVGFLDWQSSFHGHWAHDLAYFIITSLAIEERRRSDHDLVNQYVMQMRELGVSLDRDAAWREYRRHVFYACSWSMCLPEWQAEETICLITERAITAAADLDSLNA